MSQPPKYQQLSNHELYLKARDEIINSLIHAESSVRRFDDIYFACQKRNHKIWDDAYSDAMHAAEQIKFNIECNNSGRYNSKMEVVKILRIDHMEQFEMEMMLQPVSPGFGSPALDTITKTQLLDYIGKYLKQSETFVCEVRGNSMLNANITNESRLIVKKTSEAKNGNIVIVTLNGDMLVKRYIRKNGKVIFHSENDNYPDIKIKEDDELIIWGTVELVIHRPG